MYLLTVKETLGKLRETVFTEEEFRRMGVELPKFYAQKTVNNVWSDYGQYNDDTLILFKDGKSELIKLNGIDFYPEINDIHFFTISGSQKDSHTFTMNGRLATGKLFELKLWAQSRETLPMIVYAIILFGYVKDISTMELYWKLIILGVASCSLSDYLAAAIEIHNISQKIIADYPCCEMFLQSGMERMTANLKDKLNSLEILR